MISNFETEIEKHGCIVYTNVGTSMMPLIRQKRDLLVISKLKRPVKKYDIVLFKRDNGQYVLHRILKVKKDSYVLCGDNQWKREYGICDRHIIGILESIDRDGKTIKINSFKIKIYSHLWCDFYHIRALIILIRLYSIQLVKILKNSVNK